MTPRERDRGKGRIWGCGWCCEIILLLMKGFRSLKKNDQQASDGQNHLNFLFFLQLAKAYFSDKMLIFFVQFAVSDVIIIIFTIISSSSTPPKRYRSPILCSLTADFLIWHHVRQPIIFYSILPHSRLYFLLWRCFQVVSCSCSNVVDFFFHMLFIKVISFLEFVKDISY